MRQRAAAAAVCAARWQVLAPISQMPEFAAAFGCKAGDAMVAKEPIVVW